MKRREFLKKAGVVAAGAGISPLMFAKAQSTEQFRWGMPTSWPTSLDTLYGGAVQLANQVRDMSAGQLDIEVFPAGAQIGGLEVFDAVASGAFELGHSASYYYIGKDPSHNRKSTRLNSSHVKISYAVFCLKKKRKKHRQGQHKERRGSTIV